MQRRLVAINNRWIDSISISSFLANSAFRCRYVHCWIDRVIECGCFLKSVSSATIMPSFKYLFDPSKSLFISLKSTTDFFFRKVSLHKWNIANGGFALSNKYFQTEPFPDDILQFKVSAMAWPYRDIQWCEWRSPWEDANNPIILSWQRISATADKSLAVVVLSFSAFSDRTHIISRILGSSKDCHYRDDARSTGPKKKIQDFLVLRSKPSQTGSHMRMFITKSCQSFEPEEIWFWQTNIKGRSC